jgi:hypothetical protein
MKLMPDIKIPAQSRSVFIDTIDYLADEQACLRAAQPLMWQKQPRPNTYYSKGARSPVTSNPQRSHSKII